MKRLFREADRQWEETHGFSPLRVASNLAGRRSHPPTITGEDGEVLQSSIENPEQITLNISNSHTRRSGGVADSSQDLQIRNSQTRGSGGIVRTNQLEIGGSAWPRD